MYASGHPCRLPLLVAILMMSLEVRLSADEAPRRLSIDAPHISTDKSVKYDFDIVYVRGTRRADGTEAKWAEFSKPTQMEPGADLMLLHPDGSEELLVSGKDGSVLDPYVSFDGEWVFYSKFTDANHRGADIYKLHLKSRKIVKLTDQTRTPNTGAADWSKLKLEYDVFNLGPCPVPGGKVVFTSNRNAYVPPRGYPRVSMQLYVMDDDGANVEEIGYINIAGALHPVILKDGRIIFSSLESHAIHQSIHWGIWSIHPDGTNWAPVVSALLPAGGAQSGFHFQTQLSDERIVIERYYNQNQKGFGTLYTLPPRVPEGQTAFGPGWLEDPRNAVEFLDVASGRREVDRMPFTPYGMQRITPWIAHRDTPALPSDPSDANSRRIGKVTHPCGAPDNHLLVAYSDGAIGGDAGHQKIVMESGPIDSGIYLIRNGEVTDEPGDMLLIRNDPKYNEQWPRPVVPYQRIYGVAEPKTLVHKNDGKASPHLPEGTPYGLVGTSSMYKRESAPQGRVPEGKVTAEVPAQPGTTIHELQQFRRIINETNWAGQGADAGHYDNSEIHAIRILIQEPLTDVTGYRTPLFGSHANERLRILGEIPVRKFDGDNQPIDPDGNPDTSFLAKIPADQSFTFQTIDKHGMVLNMAQTWHQVRPGEVRHDCGGCHAHSQKPTLFSETAAARPDYQVFDLSRRTPLVTTKENDASGKKWDKDDETGLRYVEGPLNVEYHRDIRPIFERSCMACHSKSAKEPPAGLVLDDDDPANLERIQLAGGDDAPFVELPATYRRLVSRRGGDTFYMRRFQSRHSYLIWKIYGRRLDGYTNDTFPSTVVAKDPHSGLLWKGEKVPEFEKLLGRVKNHGEAPVWLGIFVHNYGDTDFAGSAMPPPAAVKAGKVKPLSDEDRRTLTRWIDLGCPIDLDPQYDPADPQSRSFGWMGDDKRPTIALAHPAPRHNDSLSRILVGMADAYTGLDMETFTVTADFEIDGVAAGENLASRFESLSDGRWQMALQSPIRELRAGKLTVSIKDRQGNLARVDRTFSVGANNEGQ